MVSRLRPPGRLSTSADPPHRAIDTWVKVDYPVGEEPLGVVQGGRPSTSPWEEPGPRTSLPQGASSHRRQSPFLPARSSTIPRPCQPDCRQNKAPPLPRQGERGRRSASSRPGSTQPCERPGPASVTSIHVVNPRESAIFFAPVVRVRNEHLLGAGKNAGGGEPPASTSASPGPATTWMPRSNSNHVSTTPQDSSPSPAAGHHSPQHSHGDSRPCRSPYRGAAGPPAARRVGAAGLGAPGPTPDGRTDALVFRRGGVGVDGDGQPRSAPASPRNLPRGGPQGPDPPALPPLCWPVWPRGGRARQSAIAMARTRHLQNPRPNPDLASGGLNRRGRWPWVRPPRGPPDPGGCRRAAGGRSWGPMGRWPKPSAWLADTSSRSPAT